MPRQARIDAPGALHHVIIRGIERKAIFKDAKDYRNFLDRLDLVLTETETPCFAWALMSNHAHLLLRTDLMPLSLVMRRLLTGYAQQFNRRHQRHGHVFQNRYKSVLCEQDPYLLELVRYIHLNPIRSGNVDGINKLNVYPYTGHATLMGKVKRPWQDTNYVLALFGKSIRTSRKAYLNFVSKGINFGRRPDLVGGGLIRSIGGWSALSVMRSSHLRVISDERILGSSDFVESVLKHANEAYERRTLAMAKGIGLDALIDAAANHFQISAEIIKSASKQREACRAKSIICYLAVERLGMIGAKLARHLNLTPSAVSKLISRGRSDPVSKDIATELFD
jgi:REP element-mobilizing transposase RayT